MTQGPATRLARPADRRLLARATLENLNWNGPRHTMADVETTPELRHYWDPWPGERDFGFVAEDAAAAVGVVWVRFFDEDDPGYGFVDGTIPELSVWVDSARRGRGIGGALIGVAIREARRRAIPGVSLSVEEGNPARRLYERLGFRPVESGRAEGTHLLRL